MRRKRTPEQRAIVDENRRKIGASPQEVRALLTPELNESLQKIEAQLVGMFTGFKAGPFAPAVRDISREAPEDVHAAAAGSSPEVVNAGMLTALGGTDIAGTAHRCHIHRSSQGSGGMDCEPVTSADRARDGESNLAASFRQGPGQHTRATSDFAARRRHTRNCSTGWRRSLSRTAGR